MKGVELFMANTGSSKWRRFSDYEIRVSEDGTKYVRPVPGSAPVFYDPMLKPENTAVLIKNAADELKRYENDETIVLDLMRSIGLLGLALESSGDYVFPFGGKPASVNDLRLAGRGEEYGFVFSEDYAEKYDDICAWLKSIDASAEKEPDITNLKTMAEYCIFSLTKEKKLHVCELCGKNYFSEDPDSKACSKTCEFQLVLNDPAACMEKRYCCRFFSGG